LGPLGGPIEALKGPSRVSMGIFREGPGKKKIVMVIGSLCPISVERVIRGLRWGIGPEGGKALSSHHIRTTGQNYDFVLQSNEFLSLLSQQIWTFSETICDRVFKSDCDNKKFYYS
jgi:hypothetical protein